jgi:hypothetical protein
MKAGGSRGGFLRCFFGEEALLSIETEFSWLLIMSLLASGLGEELQGPQ